MSVEKPGIQPLAFIVYGLLFFVGVALLYCELRGTFPVAVREVLPIGYLLIAFLMVNRGVYLPRGSDGQPRFAIGFKISDLAKSMICFAAGILWGVLAATVMSDTPVGNAVIGVPSLASIGMGVFFFTRSFSSRFR